MGHLGQVNTVPFSRDGRVLLSGGDAVPGEILCWRALQGNQAKPKERAQLATPDWLFRAAPALRLPSLVPLPPPDTFGHP